jgi:hypothetical protein
MPWAWCAKAGYERAGVVSIAIAIKRLTCCPPSKLYLSGAVSLCALRILFGIRSSQFAAGCADSR